MTILLVISGVLILLAGAAVAIRPEPVFAYLGNNIENSAIHVPAIAVRLILGVLLVTQSSLSRYPSAIEVLGWISIIAALVLAVMGRNNFFKLMSWTLTIIKPVQRLVGLLALMLGGFLVYAFV